MTWIPPDRRIGSSRGMTGICVITAKVRIQSKQLRVKRAPSIRDDGYFRNFAW